MTKKRRFGLVPSLSKGLTDTIHIVENNNSMYRNAVVPLDRIEPDPENPRKLLVSLSDIKNNTLMVEGPGGERRKAEFTKLQELAQSITLSGLINPIIVYKYSENYRIVAGERRFLAATLAGKSEIEARVFQEKPNNFALKLVQWFENTEREDLSIYERVGNIRDILSAYSEQHDVNATPTLLSQLTGLSLPQSSCYMTILNAADDVLVAIEQGLLTSLDKAMLIAGCKDINIRSQAVKKSMEGLSLKDLRQFIASQKKRKPVKRQTPVNTTSQSVKLGEANHPHVVKLLIHSVINSADFQHHKAQFTDINWNDPRSATNAFKQLLCILETNVVGLTHD